MAQAKAVRDRYADERAVSLAGAIETLPVILAAFDRQHEPASIADYELLLSRSHEAGWIGGTRPAFSP